jgi:polar amino acid transport system substrate-binding protein
MRRINVVLIGILLSILMSCTREPATTINSLDDLASSRFAVVTGTIADELVLQGLPDATFSYYNSPLDACIAVQKGIEVAAAYDEPILRNIMAQNQGLKMLPELITIDYYGMAVHPESVKLKQSADSLLKALQTDGRYDDMMARWFPEKGKPAPMPVITNTGRNGVLRYGTNAVTEPFAYFDDKQAIVGFDVEFVSLLAQSQGLQLEISNMEFGSLIASLLARRTDIIGACMTITEERAKSVLFTEPYYRGGIAAVVRDPNHNSPALQRDASDLETAVVGAMTGTTGEMYIRTNYPNATVLCFDDIMDAIASLQAGKADYVITAYTTALKAAGRNSHLKILPEEYSDEYAAIAFAKNNTSLHREVNEVLRRFKQNGQLDSIIQRWVRTDGSAYERTTIPHVKEGKPIQVAIAANREPMCFISNNEIVGLDCELIERIAYELGRPVKYNDMKFSALIASLESGMADLVISNMTATEERKKAVLFSDGYFVNPQVLMTINTEVATAGVKKNFFQRNKDSFYNNILHEKRYILLWNGFKVTFLIAVLAALLGTVLGGIICFMRMSKSVGLKLFARIYIDLLRGIPQVVLLMLMFYVVLAPLQFSGVTVAIITFALNFSAYVSEMFRSSIESIGKGQTEAGIAMGFSKLKTFVHIILPQAVQRVLPVYKGEFIALVKMTAIVGYIAVQDLTKASDIIRSRTFEAFFPLIMVAVIYFVLAWMLTFAIEKIQWYTSPKRKR